jgi:flagellar hook-length control protein FliK
MLSPALTALTPSAPQAAAPANASANGAAHTGDDATSESFANRLQQARTPQSPASRAHEAADGRKAEAKKTNTQRPAEKHDADKSVDKADSDEDKSDGDNKAEQDPNASALDQLLPGWSPGMTPALPAEARGKAGGAKGGDGKDAADGTEALQGAGRGPRRAAADAKDSLPTAAAGKPGQDQAPVQSFTDAQAAVANAAAATKSEKALAGIGDAKPVPASPVDAAGALASTAAQANTGAQAANASAAASAPFDAHLSAALGSPDFAPALGVQVSVLVREGVQEARLHLNPADMGPIAVQIAVEGTNARVHFQADVPATREALQNSLPDLAAALHDNGFTLSGGGVSDSGRQAFGQAQQQRDAHYGTSARDAGGNGSGNDPLAAVGSTGSAARMPRGLGVVDLYA